MKSWLEETIHLRLLNAGFKPEREHVFLEKRRFRFDFAFPKQKVAIECEGATWARGRHTRGSGFAKDCEKYNLAALNGWTVLRYTPQMIDSIIEDLKTIFSKDG